MSAKGDYFPRGANMYVPNMQYAADVNGLDGLPLFDLGTPNAANAALILSAQSIATAPTTPVTTFANGWNSPVGDMMKFGRCLQYVASGAATSTVTVKGTDYLGQGMTETITLNGATPVNGLKAFRTISNITWAATAGTTINIGTRDCFGIPYANMGGVPQQDYVNGAVPAAGTFVTYTATQSPTSGDPRGTYAPNAGVASNGARQYALTYQCLRGNLYGPRHV